MKKFFNRKNERRTRFFEKIDNFQLQENGEIISKIVLFPEIEGDRICRME